MLRKWKEQTNTKLFCSFQLDVFLRWPSPVSFLAASSLFHFSHREIKRNKTCCLADYIAGTGVYYLGNTKWKRLGSKTWDLASLHTQCTYISTVVCAVAQIIFEYKRKSYMYFHYRSNTITFHISSKTWGLAMVLGFDGLGTNTNMDTDQTSKNNNKFKRKWSGL